MCARKLKQPEPIEPVYHPHHVEITGIIIVALAIFLFVGNQYAQSTGMIGKLVFVYLFDIFIGTGKNLLPWFVGITGLILLFGKEYTREKSRIPGMIYGFLAYLMMLEAQRPLVLDSFELLPLGTHPGGLIGFLGAYLLRKFFGFAGLKIILIASILVALLMIFRVTIIDTIRGVVIAMDWLVRFIGSLGVSRSESEQSNPDLKTEVSAETVVRKQPGKPPLSAPPSAKQENVPVSRREAAPKQPALNRARQIVPGEEDFELPDLSLLMEVHVPKDHIQKREEEIKQTVRKLEETLESFKVNARVLQTSQGPTVTRYEVQPGFGVKVSKIVSLSDDIALNLAAKGVRIEAPIPGKSVVGIEIPNHTTHMVSMLPLARDERFLYSSAPLFIALGKDLDGKTLYSDLSKMPHLLVAGATGSGKSVCINSIVISLILRNTPSTVRFIMIDPKRVELSVYDDIPHLIAPVVTDPKKAAVTLRWCVREMEKRYEELARLGVRNIQSYNDKIGELMVQRDSMSEEERTNFFVPQKHSYIVVIIDELADMMLAAPAEVETSIARISQMARAVGIHLVVATQRPSVDVITGLIKANVPSRIAFAVSSQIDSRTILDGMGAEKLLGKGDMLYKPVGSMQPIRVQGVFISDQEVHSIVAHVKAQGKPEYLQEVVNLKPEDLEDLKAASSAENEEGEDEFFSEARDIVLQTRIASISYIQRKLRIGYNRAARIMEQLEEAGIVSAPDGDGKNRKVNG